MMEQHPTKRRPSTPSSRQQYTSSLAGEMQNRNRSGRNTPNDTAAPQSHGISKRTRSRSRRRKQPTDEGGKVVNNDEWRSPASDGRRTPQHEAIMKSSITQSTEEMSKESSLSSAGMGGELFVSSTPKHRLYPPPPPKVKSSTFNSSNPFGDNSNSSSNSSGQSKQQHLSRNSDPIHLLKELGRKLVQETEAEGVVSDNSRTSRGTLMTSSRSLPAPKQEFILGEASDIIARMDKLNIDQATAHHRPRKTSSSHRQQQQQQRNGDANVDDTTSNTTSAEKLARVQRRKEKEERKARRETLRQQQSSGTFTLPMNDAISPHTTSNTRGRSDMSREDIRQAAANVRARARRSASRSRERVKEAATFCGEEPSMVENDTADDVVDHISVSSHQRRRSILNPLGLEDQPRPPAIERRSHSRETMKIASQLSDEKRRARNTDQLNLLTNHVSTADELLSRRRDMRDMIRERQSHATRGRSTDYDEQHRPTDNWSRRENIRSSEEVRSRGRSRSVVRDGLSRIRSASSRALHRKSTTKGNIGGDNDEIKTIDSGKSSSIFSIKSLMDIGSRHRGRSLSRDPNNNGHDWESNLDRSGQGNKSSDSSVKSFFKRSLSRTRASSRDDRGSNISLSVDSQGIAVSANKNPFLDDEYSWAADS